MHYRVAEAKAENNARCHRLLTTINPDPYPWAEESGSLYRYRTCKRGTVGYWKRKEITLQQVREYRSWKHNRNTQFKTTKPQRLSQGFEV